MSLINETEYKSTLQEGGNIMKMKRVVAVALAAIMTVSLAACGGSGKEAKKSDKLVIWTLAKDLQDFADKYTKETGKECEVVIVDPADYPTKVQAAIQSGETEPDIVVGEPKMLDTYYEAGMLADLDELGAQDYSDKIVDYVWKKGQDADGVQRAISYQITPVGIYYRRDIAQKVFGTDDPEEISKLYADYDTVLNTAQTLKDAGYKIFASDGEMKVFSDSKEAWVKDDTLQVGQSRLDYMDLCVKLYQDNYTAFAEQWTAPWYTAMAGEIPVYEAGTDLWDDDARAEAEKKATETTEVFSYGLPSWGVLTMRDNYKDTEGKWGVCKGPGSAFDGGTYLGISANSEKKDEAWDFIKFCTLNEDTMEWWLDFSKGDTVSYIPTLEKHKDDENATYGNEKLYAFWQSEAENIDLSLVTPYDQAIGDAWASAITSIKTGQSTKEEAISAFYDEIESTYPELKVNR